MPTFPIDVANNISIFILILFWLFFRFEENSRFCFIWLFVASLLTIPFLPDMHKPLFMFISGTLIFSILYVSVFLYNRYGYTNKWIEKSHEYLHFAFKFINYMVLVVFTSFAFSIM